MIIETIEKFSATIGESARWHAKEQSVYWIDVKNPVIFRHNTQNNMSEYFSLPAPLRCIDIDTNGNLFGIIDTSLVKILVDKKIIIEVLKSNLLNDTRVAFNDGRLDDMNNFWVGSMDINFQQPIGKLFRISPLGEITEIDHGFFVSNGIAWNTDKTKLYFVDSFARLIYQYKYNKTTNEVGAREVFIEFPESQGYPDGLWLDEHDHIWVAGWGNYHIYNYSPNGQLMRKIAFPAKNITSCAFDAEKKRLFITSANFELLDGEGAGDKAGKMFICTI